MHIARRRPASKMETAIQLLQQLAALAAHEGDACAQPLFQAADYLQDVLDSADEMEEPDMPGTGLAAFETLMTSLSPLLAEESGTQA